MVSLAVQPKIRADEQKIAQALHKLEAEDPSLKVHVDSLTHNGVVDVELEVYDGKFHAVDFDEAAFATAGAHAFRPALEATAPALSEPIARLDVHVTTDCTGAVFSDLTSQRRGHVVSQESEGRWDWTHIHAQVPLSRLSAYARDLKSRTAGRGHYRVTPKGHAPMPAPEQRRVIAQEIRTHAQE